MPQASWARQEKQLLALLVTAMGCLALMKIFLATQLALYSDEIFYWQASTRPALAYSDLPFMASLLAGSGAELFGQSPLGVRALFIAMGSSIPLLMYWLAHPVVGRRQALEAALLSLCLPLAGFMGLLAVPDVPLVFLGLLLLGLVERAIRLDRAALWLAAGAVTALGLCTHYRFALYPLALFAFLLISRPHWYLWRTARLWFAGLVALTGLYPALSFNLQHDLSGVGYHFIERHPWTFQADGLLHPLIQALVVTPLLYAVLLITLIMLLRDAGRGRTRETLFAAFALAHLAVYLVLAPWSDGTRTTIHWPLSGYLPLLVYTPRAMRCLQQWLSRRMSAGVSRKLLVAVPVTGITGTLLAFAGIGSQGFNEQLRDWVGPGVLSNKMAGWQPMNRHLQQILQETDSSGQPVIVTDNYYTAAQISFSGQQIPGLYTIDEDKAVRDGRLVQYMIWDKHEAALRRRHAGDSAIFITEDSTLNVDEKLALMERACELFSELVYIDQLHLYGGDKAFSFYGGSGIEGSTKKSGHVCPRPSYLWLDYPEPDAVLSGVTTLSGWAFNEGEGIDQIRILVDGEHYATLDRDIVRKDVVQAMAVTLDPDAPQLGFEHSLDTREWENGQRTLELEVLSRSGERQHFSRRTIRIDNTMSVESP